MGHMASDCEGKAKKRAGEFDEKGDGFVKKPYQVRRILLSLKCYNIVSILMSFVSFYSSFFISGFLESTLSLK